MTPEQIRAAARNACMADPTRKRPKIPTNNRQLRDITRDSLNAIRAANDPPIVFTRMGKLVRIQQQENGRKSIQLLNEDVLTNELTRVADFYKALKGENRPCPPPAEVVHDILATQPSLWKLPQLTRIIDAPTISASGRLVQTPGYDLETQLFYDLDPNLRMPEIEETPCKDHIDIARDLLYDAICDFPFVDTASRANAIAVLLTIVCRPAIPGPTPLAILNAPTPGTGKGLLAEVISLIATGKSPTLFSAPTEAEEWRKQLTAALLDGPSLIVLDNVTHRLESGELAKALTATIYGDRLLGKSLMLSLPVQCAWIATGNNIQVSSDLARRCFEVRMDAKCPKPYLRTNFLHPKLADYVRELRGELLAAALTLVVGYFAAGCPRATIKPIGSFEAWSMFIAGVLQFAGIEGFLENSKNIYESADTESSQLPAFLYALYNRFQDQN